MYWQNEFEITLTLLANLDLINIAVWKPWQNYRILCFFFYVNFLFMAVFRTAQLYINSPVGTLENGHVSGHAARTDLK